MASASLVEGLGVERIRFLQVMGREPKNLGMHVMAVVPEELGKRARLLEVVLEERYKRLHIEGSGRP